MKKKLIYLVLGLSIVVSVGFNAYQFNTNNIIKEQTEIAQAEIDSLNEKVNSLTSEKSVKDEEIVALTEEIEKLQTSIEALENENKSLSEKLEEQLSKVAENTENKEEETPTEETPVEEPTEEEFKLTDEDIQVLKIMGATDSQIKAVKSQSDLDKLINLLINNGINGGGSGSGSGNNSGGRDDYDPSMDGNLGDPDDTVPGSM